MVCPSILPAAYQFHLSIINSPLAIDRLFPSLVKFYAGIAEFFVHFFWFFSFILFHFK